MEQGTKTRMSSTDVADKTMEQRIRIIDLHASTDMVDEQVGLYSFVHTSCSIIKDINKPKADECG